MRRAKLASIRVRTTLAATAAAAICFGSGALWLRHELYANRFQGSVAQAASDVHRLAVGDASRDDDVVRGYYGDARWIALDNDHRVVRASAGLAGHVDPVRLASGAVYQKTTPLDGKPAEFVVANVWTGPDGRITENPPVLPIPGPAGTARGIYIVPAVADTRVTYFLLVPAAEAEAAVRAVDPLLVAGLPGALVLVALVAWLTAGRALRPVEEIVAAVSGELAAITSAELHRRVPVPDTGDEIEALALTTNATLARLERSAVRQRRFIADAAHELRNPLAGLRSTVEVARANGASADLPATLEAVLASASRLQELTDDLLLLARLEHPRARPEQPVDLAAIAEEQVAERAYDGTGRVEFTVVASGPAVVTGDQLQLERLVRNPLDNADRHARTAVTVSVSATGNGDVVTEVADDGDGIAADDRERVFEPFARLDQARDRDAGGTGLGLAIARDIAVRHGGRIHLDNTPGARFTVRLPGARG